MSSGTLGTGYTVVNQQAKANNNFIAWSTNATNNFTTVITTTGPMIDSRTVPTLPYSSSEFGVGGSLQGRVVGMGLRVRYVGPTITQSGTLVAFREPNNESLAGRSLTDIKNALTAKPYPVSRDWTYINYRPVSPSEYQYSHYSQGPHGSSTNLYQMGIFVFGTSDQSGAPGPANFDCEIVCHVEYTGAPVGNLTKTHSDIQAVSLIRNAANETSSTRNPHSALAQSAVSIGRDILKYAAPSTTQSISSSPVSQALIKADSSLLNSMDPLKLLSGFIGQDSSNLLKTLGGGFMKALPYIEDFGSDVLGFAEDLLPALLF
jgi:hypothetical protein